MAYGKGFLTQQSIKKIGEWLVVILVLVWCAVLVARPINLATADLGRHLMNGKIWLEHPELRWNLLHTNLYSYTNSDFPFINHHWGTGVVLYLIFQAAGWNGLSVFYIALTLLAFFIFFRFAQKFSGSIFATAVAVLVLPIVTSRKEVRPEVFTYLFSGLFYWIVATWYTSRYKMRDLGFKSNAFPAGFFWLPVVMLLWVNLHIGFIIGIGIIGVFWLVETAGLLLSLRARTPGSIGGLTGNHRKAGNVKILSLALVVVVLAALINPAGVVGVLYPLNIFRNYGYMVLENQSIFFLHRLHMDSGLYFGFFSTIVALVMVSFIAVAVKWWRNKNQVAEWNLGMVLVHFILFLTFAGLATLAIRDFPLFGLFALPILAYNLKFLLPERLYPAYRKIFVGAAVAICCGIVLRVYLDMQAAGEVFGIGLAPGVAAAADFYQSSGIQGPIFNNYDNGGYLIYYFFPTQQVFVDNRPEAYPVPFFQNIYIPAQEDDSRWKELDGQYRFNAIFFYYHDYTPWAQAFLISRVKDPNWAPVFADGYNIIFLKRNTVNQELIKKYELPKSMFGITQ